MTADIKVLKNELYLININNVNRLTILNENEEVLIEAAKTFDQENEATIIKIEQYVVKRLSDSLYLIEKSRIQYIFVYIFSRKSIKNHVCLLT